MTNKTFRSPCLLGLVDGILIGALTGALIAIYVEHRNAQILDEILDRSLLTETFHLIGRTELLWIICINFFIWIGSITIASWLVHKYLLTTVPSPIRIWACIGTLGVFVASLIAATAVETDFFFRGRHYGELNLKDNLVPLSKMFVLALLTVLATNYLYGAALEISAGFYNTWKNRPDVSAAGGVRSQ